MQHLVMGEIVSGLWSDGTDSDCYQLLERSTAWWRSSQWLGTHRTMEGKAYLKNTVRFPTVERQLLLVCFESKNDKKIASARSTSGVHAPWGPMKALSFLIDRICTPPNRNRARPRELLCRNSRAPTGPPSTPASFSRWGSRSWRPRHSAVSVPPARRWIWT